MTKEEFAKVDHHWVENLISQRDNALEEIEQHKVTISEKDHYHEQKLFGSMNEQGIEHQKQIHQLKVTHQAEKDSIREVINEHIVTHNEICEQHNNLKTQHTDLKTEYDRVKDFEEKISILEHEIQTHKSIIQQQAAIVDKLQEKIETMESHPDVIDALHKKTMAEFQASIDAGKHAELKLAAMENQ